jgi:hypothetical protein
VSFDPDSPQARSEFLEADGIGGYASGPVAGAQN